ncbi:Ubiquitin carboxyl-terminal hydrolase 16 [Clonorchis sinensis]|uniref:Ubiquitin carboxyl-terminal hydrolase n=1 Tax=Clonorchis sinensis TaxID=79923 RepID=A0A8T1MGD1_CLOSI|nr:Ubiquitin carboxyl-terminal hydrolase 16 [Clonorchis sinensis]
MVKKTRRNKDSAVVVRGAEDLRLTQRRGQFLVKGLHNLGNTCYLNSSLQCLSRSPYFLELLSSPPLSGATLKRPDGDSVRTLQICLPIMKAPITKRFTELCASLRDMRSDASGPCSLNPASLRESILERYPRFSGFGQQDSHEILRALLDCLKQEELMRWRKGILEKLSIDVKNVSSEDRQLIRTWGRAASIATIVDRLFGGILISTLQCCVCGTIRTSFEPFLDLSLPITDAKASFGRRSAPGKHEGVGKSKQELKRDRKKKKKGKPKRENRRRLKQEMDCPAVSSDGDSVDEPIESESPPLNVPCYSVTPADDDAVDSKPLQEQLHCTSAPRFDLTSDGVAPGKPVVQTHSNGVTSQASSVGSMSRVGSSDSSNGGCADAEDSDEDRIYMKAISSCGNELSPNSTLPKPDASNDANDEGSYLVETNTYLADQLAKIHLHSHDCGPLGTEELLQASRLSQLPLRSSNSEWCEFRSGDNDESLYTCLSRFTTPEHLCGSNRIQCDTCSGRDPGYQSDASESHAAPNTRVYRDAIRRDLILEPPALLTIHLKRFQQFRNNLQKSQKPVKFPLILDISPFCSTLYLSPCDSVCYRLYGVVEHMGRLAGGHYVAYVAATAPNIEQDTESSPTSDRLKGFLQKFVGSLDHPPKWPLTVHDLVRRLRRCSRSQLLHSVSELSSFVNQGTDSPDSTENEVRTEPEEADKRTWFRCSDSHVSWVPVSTVLDCQPFLLFYERITS